MNSPWESYVDFYSWILRTVSNIFEGPAGTHSGAIGIIGTVLIVRTLMLPLTIRSVRAIAANRKLVKELRGVTSETKGSKELMGLYRKAASPLKDSIVYLAVQLPILVPLYFAVRDFTKAQTAMPFLGIDHLKERASSSFLGFILILIIILVSVRSGRAIIAHLDDPTQRQPQLIGPFMNGAIFFIHPFIAGWALAFLAYFSYQRVQEWIVLRKELPPPVTARGAPLKVALPPEGDQLLACHGLAVGYDKIQVLFNVDLEINKGEIVALLGTNGAGKSTLLKAISGLLGPTSGNIFFDGQEITGHDPIEIAKLGIAQVPGGRGIFPTLSVQENLRTAAWLFRKDTSYAQKAVTEIQATFPVLGERGQELAGNLSGGEQQMLTLGMAFLAKPKLLLVDELSLGLAPTIVDQLVGILRGFHDQGTTVMLVEQSVNVALTIADRAYFMEKGEVRFSGSTADLLNREDLLRSVFLEGAGSVDGNSSDVKTPHIATPHPLVREDTEPVLEIKGVSKHFGGITAVDDVSFRLLHTQILGLIGPNGSGKTTIMDTISGFLQPDTGQILFGGEEISNWGPDRRARAGLGRSFQDARIFPSLTVAENLATGLERHLEVRDHLAAALYLPDVREVEIDVAWTVADLIELMGLGPFRDKFVSELSTGTRRIVELAMSVAHNPSVFLLDEPSSGIAQRETEALGPLLLRIRDETDCSLLVIEHDMPLITGISDRIIALETGALIAEGLPSEVINNPRVIKSYLGGDFSTVIHRSGNARAKAAKTAKAREVKTSAR